MADSPELAAAKRLLDRARRGCCGPPGSLPLQLTMVKLDMSSRLQLGG
jgi:hypothetical protein